MDSCGAKSGIQIALAYLAQYQWHVLWMLACNWFNQTHAVIHLGCVFFLWFCIIQGYWHNALLSINQIIEKGIYIEEHLNGTDIMWYHGLPMRSPHTCATYNFLKQCKIFMHRPLDEQWQICECRPLLTFTAHSKTRSKNFNCYAGLELSVSKGQHEG